METEAISEMFVFSSTLAQLIAKKILVHSIIVSTVCFVITTLNKILKVCDGDILIQLLTFCRLSFILFKTTFQRLDFTGTKPTHWAQLIE
jgi:hypothetical protein